MPIMYFGDHAMRALIHSPTPTLSAKAWRLPPRCLASYIAPAGPPQQHDELVPAETCHGIDGAGGSLEPPRRLAQHEVAGRMAMDVIDWLETVEIYEQNREGSGVAARGGNGLLDTIVQERPVDESS